MTRWPHDGDRIVETYVAGLGLRGPCNRIYYRQTLRSFHAAVIRRGATDRGALEHWLRDRDSVWARSTLVHRVGILARFLGTLAARGLIAADPFAELRARHDARGSRRIALALLAPDPGHALERLRQPVRFGSVLGGLMREHVALMQARGYRYQTQVAICLRFDRFLQARPELADHPLEDMLRCWGAARATANHQAECERLARILDRARRHADPALTPRRPDEGPMKRVAETWRRPYIFSPEEIGRLLQTARAYPSPCAPSRPINLHTMLVLLYCAGLRMGELARLTLGDVDMRAGTIAIRETKFYKTRLLPLSDSATAALGTLLAARRAAKVPIDPTWGLFWHDQGNRGYGRATMAYNLVEVLRRAGIKPPEGKVGPRLHDLRHTFVVHRIL